MWNARGTVSRWNGLNEEWWWERLHTSFLPTSNGEVSGLLVFTPCLHDDYSYDCAEGLTFCKMLYDLSSIAATWQRYICLVDLEACRPCLWLLYLITVWCSWTCATADGLCHAAWGMSVPAVLWSLKWDHLMSLAILLQHMSLESLLARFKLHLF